MVQMLLLAAAFWAVQVVATRRGRWSPLWRFLAAGLGWGGQIVLLDIWIAPSGVIHWPSVWAAVTVPPLLAGLLVAAILVALPSIDRRTAEKRTWVPYRPLGWFLAALAGLAVVAIFVDLATQARDPFDPPRLQPGPWMRFVLLLVGSQLCFHLGARAAQARRNAIEGDPRPPVLLLRSFAGDRVVQPRLRLFGRIPWRGLTPPSPFDGHIAPLLDDRLGPVVTFGDPEDDLPAIGARRLYPGDGEWREAVTALMDRAAAVLILEGDGEGLAWELGQVRARVPPDRVLLLTLPTPFRRDQGLLWWRFAARAADLGYDLPKPDPGPGAVLRLDGAWRAEAAGFGREPAEMVEHIVGALGRRASAA